MTCPIAYENGDVQLDVYEVIDLVEQERAEAEYLAADLARWADLYDDGPREYPDGDDFLDAEDDAHFDAPFTFLPRDYAERGW